MGWVLDVPSTAREGNRLRDLCQLFNPIEGIIRVFLDLTKYLQRLLHKNEQPQPQQYGAQRRD